MSATLQQECYAALWSALFRSTNSLDRYAGQGELFNRDQGEPEPAPAPKPDHFPDTPRQPTHEYRERVEIFPHKRDASGARALRDELKARPNVVTAKIEDDPGGGTAIRVLTGQRIANTPQPRTIPRPAFMTEGPLKTERATAGLDLGERPGPMFPDIERTPEHHWLEQSTITPTRASAQGLLAEQRRRVGFHQGEIVPAGKMWRVNRLYRFPRVQYPAPVQETR